MLRGSAPLRALWRRRGALSAATSLQATPPTSPDNPIYSLSQGGFYGGGGQLGACMCLAFATIAWVLAIMFPTFAVLKILGLLRVSAEVEASGMDVSKHGGSAYTTEA